MAKNWVSGYGRAVSTPTLGLPFRLTFVLCVALPLVGCGNSSSTVAPVTVPASFSQEAAVQRLIDTKYQAAAADPGNPARHRTLGLALVANEGWELGELSFRNALELDPDDHESRYQLASALGQRGDLDGQIRELRVTIENDPAFYPALYSLGCALLDRGELDGAASMFEKVQVGQGPTLMGELGLGLVAMERDQPKEALTLLTAAAKKYPSDEFIQFQIGQAYLALGLEDKATRILAGVQDAGGRPRLRSPGSAEADRYAMSRGNQIDRALEMIARDQHALAIPILEDLLEADSADSAAANNLYVAYMGAGKLGKALGVIDDAIRESPDQYSGHLNRGACLLRRAEQTRTQGRTTESRQELEQALASSDVAVRLAPRFGRARLLRAQILSALRRDAESITAFRKGIELGETQESTYIDMNVPVVRFEGPIASEELLREALQHPGTRPRVRFELCGVLLKSGRGAEARAEQREMSRLAPGHPYARQANEILTAQGY